MFSMGATAHAKETDLKRPKIFDEVVECRAITDPTARLKCYDEKVAALDSAQKDNQLIIADKADVQEARRGLFGLSLPKIRIFSGGDGDEITQIETTISRARQGPRGKWLVNLADGSRWQQIDNRRLGRYPKKGSNIRIRAASMGSYFANIEGQTAIRVKRVN